VEDELTIMQAIKQDVEGALSWAKSEMAKGERWLSGETCIFGAAFLAQLKQEIPQAEHAFVASLQDLLKQTVTSIEKTITDPDQKFGVALSTVWGIVERDGVGGVKAALLSTTLRETAIQIAVSALRAGLFAVI
jgi:hypothetical protein